MSAILCKYHLALPARWCCEQCQFNLCAGCAPRSPGAAIAMCPSCRAPLKSLGMGNAIKPFWERIPRFFLYPAKLGPLATALALSVGGMLGIVPIFGVAALLAMSIICIRYCYRVLYHTALGNLEPPEISRETEFSGIFWQQTCLFIVLFGGAALLGGLTGSVAILVVAMVVVLLLLPAAIMTLAIEESLASAINPLRLLDVASRIGKPYLLLWVMLLLLLSGSGLLVKLIPFKQFPLLGLFVYNFVSNYFFIAMFHMMGYVVYQYHEQLGFSAVKDYAESEEGANQYRQQAVAPIPDRVQILITEGKFAEAAAELELQVRQNPDDLRVHERYFRLMLTQADKKEQGAAHADLYIGKLLAEMKTDKALDVYRDGTARWGGIEIKDADDAVALAAHAQRRNESKLGLPLLAHFAQRFPGHAKIPEAQLLVAEMLSHGLGRDQMALQILGQLLRAYPEHPLKPRMQTLFTTLSRLQQRKNSPQPAVPR